jgi:hypothetical protein
VKNESPAAKSAAEFSAEFRSDPERNRLYLESKARLSNETAMQERAALSELELASIRQWIEVGPGFTPAYAELSGLLATIDERDELIEELESRAGMDGAAIKAACKEIEVREEALQRVLAVCAEYEGPKKVAKARCGCRTWVTTDEIRAALPILREAASVEPSDEEVAEVWRVSSPPDARVYSEGARDRMRAALSAFLSARKQGET